MPAETDTIIVGMPVTEKSEFAFKNLKLKKEEQKEINIDRLPLADISG